MICPNCKSHNSNDSSYCNICGTKLTSTYREVQKKKTIKSEEDDLKAFIGKNYESIKKGTFSIPGCIFGSFYFLYKKMITYAFLSWIVILLTYSYQEEIACILVVLLHLGIGMKGNHLFYYHASRVVDEIKLSHPESTEEELLKLCEEKGRPFHPLLFVLFFLLFISFIFTRNPNKAESTEEKIASIGSFSYKISTSFQKGKYQQENYQYYFYIDEENNCSITLQFQKGKKLESNLEEKENVLLGERTWIKKKELEETHYYLEEDGVYHIKFHSQEGEICQKGIQEFLQSIKRKTS